MLLKHYSKGRCGGSGSDAGGVGACDISGGGGCGGDRVLVVVKWWWLW